MKWAYQWMKGFLSVMGPADYVMFAAVSTLACIGAYSIWALANGLNSEIGSIEDPMERGLCWIAAAIVVHAFIRGRSGGKD